MNIKALAVPMFVALSLIFGACAEQTIESPDAVDGAVQEGIEGVEQGAEDAGNAIDNSLDNLQQGAEDAGNAVEEGVKNIEKGAEDAAGAAQEGIKQGTEDAGNVIKDMGEKIPGSDN